MKNEADFKKHFKASVRAQGGFSISLAAPMINGMPDLFVAMPGYIPVLIEAKWLGKCDNNSFKRKINYRPLQREMVRDCHKVTPYSAFILVGVNWKNTVYAVLVGYDTFHFDRLTDSFIVKNPYTTNTYRNRAGDKLKLFSPSDLFLASKIPKMNLTYTPTCGSVPVETQIGDIGATTTSSVAI